MLICVTGATGFLGGYICSRLRLDGHEIRATARPTSELSHVQSLGAEIRTGDLADTKFLNGLTAGCGCVVHAAFTDAPEDLVVAKLFAFFFQ